MQKISGILPQSSRVASVDLSESQPVRPGVPSFGRPVGRSPSTFADRFNVSATASERLDRMLSPREQRHVNIARSISDSFFKKNEKPAVEIAEDNYGLDMMTSPVDDPRYVDSNYGQNRSVESEVGLVGSDSQDLEGLDQSGEGVQAEGTLAEAEFQQSWSPIHETESAPINEIDITEDQVQETIDSSQEEMSPDPYAPKGQFLDRSA